MQDLVLVPGDLEYEREHAAWCEGRVAELKAPHSWLSMAGLSWLTEGRNTLGSAAESTVRFPAHAPPTIGTLEVQDHRFELTMEPGVEATVNGELFKRRSLPVSKDPLVAPDMVEMPPFSFKIIRRGGKPALRLYDATAPSLAKFKGIESFPLDRSWRVEARYEAYETPKMVEVATAISTTEKVAIPGKLTFELQGKEHTLYPFAYPGVDELYLMFGDKTNGITTYGGGRFLVFPNPKSDTVILDFNRAYNPPCVYTEFATCPLPRPENRLPLPITAGEQTH